MPKMYKLTLSESESDAIAFHGCRSLVSEFLLVHMFVDDPTSETNILTFHLELEYHEAWTLRNLWEEEGPLSCGSKTLNEKLEAFVNSIV